MHFLVDPQRQARLSWSPAHLSPPHRKVRGGLSAIESSSGLSLAHQFEKVYTLMAGSQDPSDSTTIYPQPIQTAFGDTSTTPRDGNLNNSPRSDDCCVICLDTISEPCTTHPCAHGHFDFLCLLSWLEQRPSCPLCQSPVFKVSHTSSEGESVYRVPNAPRKRTEENRNLRDTRPQRIGIGLAELNTSRVYRRQRPHREPPRPPVTEADAIEHRRHVYRHMLYSLRTSIPAPCLILTPVVSIITNLIIQT